MSHALTILAALALAYGLGSIPTAYLYGRLRGLDIRQQGSGNPGATNVLRVFGTLPGLLVLLVDVGKGLAAVWYAPQITPYPQHDLICVGCGLAAILGHAFNLWLRGKGGKGVATTYGVMLGLAPLSTLLVFLAFLAMVAATRYVSLGSLVTAALFPWLIWILGESGRGFSILILAVVLAGVIFVRHLPNLRRLQAGTENRVGQKKSPGA